MVKKGISTRKSKLYKSLEKRLEVLTNNLLEADITEKSIDLVKEIKELHALLRVVKGEDSGDMITDNSKIVLVWGDSMNEAKPNIISENTEYNLKS